jgi:serine/threonine protein kinase
MQALYAELKEVGRGPHATVYRARDQVLGRDVAVKELDNWNDRPAAAVARLRFGHAQAHLQAPNVLDACIADAERGRLAMEFIPEGSLADHIARHGPLPAAQVRQVLIGTLEALAHFHRHGLLHAAVKPSNLFLDSNGRVLLADGLGLPLGKGRTVYPAPLTPQEAKYLAPEWADTVGAAADLYSLGLTLLELLLASDFELLFPQVLGRAIPWTEWHRSDRQLPPVSTLVPGLPRDLAIMLDRLLRKRPEERFPSAVEALDSIRPSPHGFRRWGGPALVAGACVAVVVLAVLLVVRPWEPDAQVVQLQKERDNALEYALQCNKQELLAKRSEEHRMQVARENEAKARSKYDQLKLERDELQAAHHRLESSLAEAQAQIERLKWGPRRLRYLSRAAD